jgi:Tfp pilus assembly protein PilF
VIICQHLAEARRPAAADRSDVMDLTSITIAILIAIGLLGTDAVVHSGSVEIEASIAPNMDKLAIDERTIADEFQDQFDAITSTASVVRPPEIRARDDEGIGLAIAQAVGAEKVAFALQRQLGYKPDTIRFTLFNENGKLRGLVHGHSHLIGNINRVMIPNPDETLVAFVQRSALWAASTLAPYSTALFLLQKHAADKDFKDTTALIEHAESLLPPTPTSMDRALFDNLRGLIALFANDSQGARKLFTTAMFDDVTNPVPFLNAAFVDIQLDEYQKAADRMAQLVRDALPADKVLRATAYMTWGAARMGLKDLHGADHMFALAIQANPNSSTAFGLWAEEKELEGDQAAAARLHLKAKQASATFENYDEIAVLYFHLAWQNNMPMTRNNFSNPDVVTFH